jgi:glycogen synthase
MSEAMLPLRILMTADAVGGVWTYALTLAEALATLPEPYRAEVVLAVMGPPPSAVQRACAARIATLRLVERDFPLEWMPEGQRDLARAATWLREQVAACRPDIIHLNSYALAAASWPVPVIVAGHSCIWSWWSAVHGGSPPPQWDDYRRSVAAGLASAAGVVAPSRTMLRALARHYTLPHGGRVIANGCALERFLPVSKEPFVLAAGRLWDEAKNLAALDRAATRLPWPVYVAGDTQRPDGGTVAPQGARSLGRLDHETLARWMSRAAVYAHPARYEPFGLSVLEAAASGCALVLGDIPSLRELWHGAAVFVPPENPDALGEAIAALMRDSRRRTWHAKEAGRRAQDFSARNMALCYAQLYGELAGASVNRPASMMASSG